VGKDSIFWQGTQEDAWRLGDALKAPAPEFGNYLEEQQNNRRHHMNKVINKYAGSSWLKSITATISSYAQQAK
jgi:hypothetical protein